MWSFQIVLFILSAAVCWVSRAAGLVHVFGYEGRAVNVPCPYGKGYESYEKYLCKDPCKDKDVLTRSQRNKNKYSIYDNQTSRIFTVTISDLRLDDAQKYWCGVTRTGIKDIYTEAKLEVKEDRCCNTVDKTQSIEEGSVTISCPYDSQSVHKLKFFCRGNRPSTCLQQALITSSNTQHGRFKLSDDRRSSIFTVTISSLTLNDSGSYLCGVQRNSGFDDFSAVELEVKELKSFNISDIEGRPVTLQCPNSIQQHDNKMFFCKGDQHNNCTDMMENQTKFKLHKVSSSCFSVIISELEAADAGTYYCGSDSQLSFRKIQLAVVSPLPSSSVAPTITTEQPPSHNPDVSLFYILSAVFALLLILTFVLLLVLRYKTRIKQVNGINVNELNSADLNVEMRINDVSELQEDVIYINSSTPNMLNHDDNDLYNNIL